MKTVGSLLRYLLNINTIWGLLILVAFVLCLVQHYLPVSTTIPADTLHAGTNAVLIQVMDMDGKKVTPFEYSLTLGPGGLIIPDEDRRIQAERPYLISARAARTGYTLKWDYDGYGRYSLAVNGVTVKKRGPLANLGGFSDAAIDYATKAFTVALGLVATMVLFLGLMKVGEDAGIVQLVARVFHPVIRFLFPQVPREHPANGAILMNMTTTILGLGNAATPFGLKAIKELQTLNPHPDVATDAQVTLIAYNTAGLALIPTMLLAVRKSAGCSDPFEIIGTCLLTGAVSTTVAIIMAKLLARLPFFSVRSALAEGDASISAPSEEQPAKSLPEKEVAVAGSEEQRS
jgi:spore maturation protein A